MFNKEEADEKVKGGWMRIWVAFEALAVNQEAVSGALSTLISKMCADDRMRVYRHQMGSSERVENPLKGIAEAWSQTAEVEFVIKNFDDLVQVVMEYGPSAIELRAPSSLKLDCSVANATLNGVADMMHRIATSRFGGGMVLLRDKQ